MYFNTFLGLVRCEKHPNQNLISFSYTTSAKSHEIFGGLVMEVIVPHKDQPYAVLLLEGHSFVPKKIVATPFPSFDKSDWLSISCSYSNYAIYPQLMGTLAIVFRWQGEMYPMKQKTCKVTLH